MKYNKQVLTSTVIDCHIKASVARHSLSCRFQLIASASATLYKIHGCFVIRTMNFAYRKTSYIRLVTFKVIFCCELFKHYFSSEIIKSWCIIISATSSVSCKFGDIDICGYQDLSETGTKWSQVNNNSESFTVCLWLTFWEHLWL